MSGSMSDMKQFAKDIVDSFDLAHTKFGVVSFNGDATTRTIFSSSQYSINTAIDAMYANGYTSISDGFDAAGTMFDSYHRDGATKIVLLLSDGEQTTDGTCSSRSYCTDAQYRQAAINSATELKEALESRKLDTSGDKQALYERLKEALEAEDAKVVKETVTHEVVANVLVGAEEAEAKLEALLQRKRELLGEV